MSTVSVILPSYNSQGWICEAAKSVLDQTHQELELIIIDDGSVDNTITSLSTLSNDPRLTIIKRASCSGGPATPRNEGIQAASGGYLAFIDSDDVWHPRKLELQLKAMRQHGLNFLSSAHISFRDTIPSPPPIDHVAQTIHRKDHHQLLSKNWVVTSSAIMSKQVFDCTQFNQSPNYVGVEDYLAWLHIHQRDDIKSAVLAMPLVFYRTRHDSISSSKRAMATKIFYLLSHYQQGDKPLGLKRFYFFASYALHSIMARLAQQFKRR